MKTKVKIFCPVPVLIYGFRFRFWVFGYGCDCKTICKFGVLFRDSGLPDDGPGAAERSAACIATRIAYLTRWY